MSATGDNQRTHSLIEKNGPTQHQQSYSSYFVVVENAGNHATILALERIKKYYKTMKSVAELDEKRFRALSKIVSHGGKQSSQTSHPERAANTFSYQDFVQDAFKIVVADVSKCEANLKNLEDHLKSIKELMDTYDAQRKQLSSDIEKCKSKLFAKISHLDSKRRIYHKKFVDHQTALKLFNNCDQDVNATKKSVEDAKQIEVEKFKCLEDSKSAYAIAIQDFNNEQSNIHVEITAILSQLQTNYASLLMSFKEETVKFTDLYHSHLQSLSTSNCEKKEIATKINPERDMQLVINETESNSLKLPDQSFIEYLTVVPSKSSPDIKRKPNRPLSQTTSLSALPSIEITTSDQSQDSRSSVADTSKKKKVSMFKNLFSHSKSPTISPTISEEAPSRMSKTNSSKKHKDNKNASPSQSKNPFDNLQFDPNDKPEDLLKTLQKLDDFLIVKAKEIAALDKMGDTDMSESCLSLANKMRDNYKIYQETFQNVYNTYSSVSTEPYAVKYKLVDTEFHFSDDEDQGDENKNSTVVTCPTQVESSPSTKKCIALYDFTGSEPDDLSIVQGEDLIFISVYDSSWSRVERNNGSGESGLVPTSYIQIT